MESGVETAPSDDGNIRGRRPCQVVGNRLNPTLLASSQRGTGSGAAAVLSSCPKLAAAPWGRPPRCRFSSAILCSPPWPREGMPEKKGTLFGFLRSALGRALRHILVSAIARPRAAVPPGLLLAAPGGRSRGLPDQGAKSPGPAACFLHAETLPSPASASCFASRAGRPFQGAASDATEQIQRGEAAAAAFSPARPSARCRASCTAASAPQNLARGRTQAARDPRPIAEECR